MVKHSTNVGKMAMDFSAIFFFFIIVKRHILMSIKKQLCEFYKQIRANDTNKN